LDFENQRSLESEAAPYPELLPGPAGQAIWLWASSKSPISGHFSVTVAGIKT
jgi:hypothetical protein